MLHLQEGIFLELLGIELRTGTELQCLFTEGVADGVVWMIVSLVDDIIQGGTGEVSQEDGLRVGRGLQSS